MNSKLLPIVIPPIIGYTVHAYPLSVLLTDDRCLPWFHSNYVQLCCNTALKGEFFDFFTLVNIFDLKQWIDSIYPGIPWLYRNVIGGTLLNKSGMDLNKLVTNAINNDFYCVTYLDQYYMPNRYPYKKYHYTHEVMLYGCNIKNEQYDILGYDEKRIFRNTKLSFKEFETAFNSCNPDFTSIGLLRINEYFSYNLDLKLIIELLGDYLNSRNSFERLRILRNPQENYVFGLNVYNELARYAELVSKEPEGLDIRPFHILWEHKKCMSLRLEYIRKKINSLRIADSINDYKEIENICLNFRNMVLKHNVIKESAIISRLSSELYRVKYIEQKVLLAVVSELERMVCH